MKYFFSANLSFLQRHRRREMRCLDLTLNVLYISWDTASVYVPRNSLNSRSTTGSALLGRMPNGILGRVRASLKWVIAAEWSARYLRCTSSIARLQPFPKRPYALCTKVYRMRAEHACRRIYVRGKSSRNIVVE